ncbi:KTSC domain-containing protein [Alloalcanivorax gelatiniphagus]|uniref:KTSC domain-containing protein n=1 Tax=Alloalcanivorax gelatiniphagus TaxID=1194167 RepID=A0ABY2XKU5_9GAMM|nr:KTSC domain-containing protein [Alloalcanivorax gelatiniphagus]TMW12759.1 KTSC domain-containing protein [Alloalcanivorax gelatiniphagus]|tara:strand:+ start:8684 stop:8893 length:210 start_codon:yes stop_codon:yes gene_type:complete
MERISVSSSNIASIGYDEGEKILEVEFLNGGVYQYFDVPQETYEGFINAESHGKFLWAYVRGVFPCQEV